MRPQWVIKVTKYSKNTANESSTGKSESLRKLIPTLRKFASEKEMDPKIKNLHDKKSTSASI